MIEAWLRGPVDDVPEALVPAAHSLLDALEDMERAAAALTLGRLWLRPGGAASVGFHLRHARGSTERLLAYARGESLGTEMLEAIAREGDPGDPPETATELLEALRRTVHETIDTYRTTPPEDLSQPRKVGRAGLPSTVRGLLFHAAEHARRHAGQAVATAMIIEGMDLAGGD